MPPYLTQDSIQNGSEGVSDRVGLTRHCCGELCRALSGRGPFLHLFRIAPHTFNRILLQTPSSPFSTHTYNDVKAFSDGNQGKSDPNKNRGESSI